MDEMAIATFGRSPFGSCCGNRRPHSKRIMGHSEINWRAVLGEHVVTLSRIDKA